MIVRDCSADFLRTRTARRVWQSGCAPRIQLRMVRHDDIDRRTGEYLIGVIDFYVYVEPDTGAREMDGSLECNEMRALGAFLTALADEVDPHHVNGEPDEWHILSHRTGVVPS